MPQPIATICFCIFLTFCPSLLSAKEKMTWSVVHWPPLMMLRGDDAGEGRNDYILKRFQQKMPQYQHETIEMNWNRTWIGLKAGKRFCHILALKNDQREKFALFSKPSNVTLSNRIIMLDSTYQKLGRPKSLSLTDLLHNSQLKGAIESNRSYTAILDEIINKRPAHSHMEVMINKGSGMQLLRMLLVKRFDYMIEYSYVTSYLHDKIPDSTAQLHSVIIDEIPSFTASYLACPNTAWGAARITEYNQVFDSLKHSADYLQIIQMWYSSKEEKQLVRESYQKLITSK